MHYIFHNAFSINLCDSIIKLSEKLGYQEARLHSYNENKGILNKTSRGGYVSFLYKNNIECAEIINEINNIVIQKQKEKFDINYDELDYQVAKYVENEVGFNWHTDDGFIHQNFRRKLTCIVQLSDKLDYEGGLLKLHDFNNGHIVSKDKGTMVIFPSFYKHMVSPVTKGIRYSLTVWIKGPKWS